MNNVLIVLWLNYCDCRCLMTLTHCRCSSYVSVFTSAFRKILWFRLVMNVPWSSGRVGEPADQSKDVIMCFSVHQKIRSAQRIETDALNLNVLTTDSHSELLLWPHTCFALISYSLMLTQMVFRWSRRPVSPSNAWHERNTAVTSGAVIINNTQEQMCLSQTETHTHSNTHAHTRVLLNDWAACHEHYWFIWLSLYQVIHLVVTQDVFVWN